MNKKEILLPLLITGLSILFVFICLAVCLSGGKSKKWVDRKIRIGALLLCLSGAIGTGCHPFRTCYAPVAPNRVSYENIQLNVLYLSKSKNREINLSINYISSEVFSYRISDTALSSTIIKDNFSYKSPDLEGTFAKFIIQLPPALNPGKYMVMVYSVAKEQQANDNFISKVEMILTE